MDIRESLVDRLNRLQLEPRIIITTEIESILNDVKNYNYNDIILYDKDTKVMEDNSKNNLKLLYARRIVTGSYFENRNRDNNFNLTSAVRCYDKASNTTRYIIKLRQEENRGEWAYRAMGSRLLSFNITKEKKKIDAFYSALYICDNTMNLIKFSKKNKKNKLKNKGYELLGLQDKNMEKLFLEFREYVEKIKNECLEINFSKSQEIIYRTIMEFNI